MTTITWPWAAGHEETERHLSDELDGELRGVRRWRIVRHLARCEGCAAAYRSLRRTVDGLRALRLVEPEPAAARSVAGEVLERIRWEPEVSE